jgi:ATP-dependent DNA helicase RecQ
MDEFLNIQGIGTFKAQKFGNIFLKIINDYLEQNNISVTAIPQKVMEAKKAAEKTPRHMIVGEAYNNGRSINELMAEYKVKIATIIDHLYKYLLEGNSLRQQELYDMVSLPDDVQSKVFTAFDEIGPEKLSPVFQKLNSEVSYDNLHFLRLLYLTRKNNI